MPGTTTTTEDFTKGISNLSSGPPPGYRPSAESKNLWASTQMSGIRDASGLTVEELNRDASELDLRKSVIQSRNRGGRTTVSRLGTGSRGSRSSLGSTNSGGLGKSRSNSPRSEKRSLNSSRGEIQNRSGDALKELARLADDNARKLIEAREELAKERQRAQELDLDQEKRRRELQKLREQEMHRERKLAQLKSELEMERIRATELEEELWEKDEHMGDNRSEATAETELDSRLRSTASSRRNSAIFYRGPSPDRKLKDEMLVLREENKKMRDMLMNLSKMQEKLFEMQQRQLSPTNPTAPGGSFVQQGTEKGENLGKLGTSAESNELKESKEKLTGKPRNGEGVEQELLHLNRSRMSLARNEINVSSTGSIGNGSFHILRPSPSHQKLHRTYSSKATTATECDESFNFAVTPDSFSEVTSREPSQLHTPRSTQIDLKGASNLSIKDLANIKSPREATKNTHKSSEGGSNFKNKLMPLSAKMNSWKSKKKEERARRASDPRAVAKTPKRKPVASPEAKERGEGEVSREKQTTSKKIAASKSTETSNNPNQTEKSGSMDSLSLYMEKKSEARKSLITLKHQPSNYDIVDQPVDDHHFNAAPILEREATSTLTEKDKNTDIIQSACRCTIL